MIKALGTKWKCKCSHKITSVMMYTAAPVADDDTVNYISFICI